VQPERLALLAQLLDEGTFAVLAARGVGPGWRCLEVGAGGGSVAAWLAGRVAPGGFVLATDLDTTVLRSVHHPCLEVRAHDILAGPLPEAGFGLVHARLLLAWLDAPQTGLARMAAALRPGGCLVAEEMDFRPVAADPRHGPATCDLFGRVIAAHHTVLADQHAFDPFRGRRLAGDLAQAGLINTGCQGRLSIWQGGQPGGRVWQLTLLQLRPELAASGLVTGGEVDRVIDLCGDPGFRFMSQATIAAWGYRPR
jgi:SAM-dependent methyltransferase